MPSNDVKCIFKMNGAHKTLMHTTVLMITSLDIEKKFCTLKNVY